MMRVSGSALRALWWLGVASAFAYPAHANPPPQHAAESHSLLFAETENAGSESLQLTPPRNPARFFGELSDHYEASLGDYDTLFHEQVSSTIHLDVLVFAPTEERPYVVLLTSGMSDEALPTPDGASGWSSCQIPPNGRIPYMELAILLPPEAVSMRDGKLDEPAWRPYAIALMDFARKPHATPYFLWRCHTISAPQSDSEPFSDLDFFHVDESRWLPPEARRLTTIDGLEIEIFTLVTLSGVEFRDAFVDPDVFLRRRAEDNASQFFDLEDARGRTPPYLMRFLKQTFAAPPLGD